MQLEDKDADCFASFDHYPIPRSKGGKLTRDNTKLAHKLCNIRRGDGSKEVAVVPVKLTVAKPPVLLPDKPMTAFLNKPNDKGFVRMVGTINGKQLEFWVNPLA